jgi:hypothetical protein
VNAMADRFGSLETRGSLSEQAKPFIQSTDRRNFTGASSPSYIMMIPYMNQQNPDSDQSWAPTACQCHMLPRSVRLISLAPSVNLLKVISEASKFPIPVTVVQTVCDVKLVQI